MASTPPPSSPPLCPHIQADLGNNHRDIFILFQGGCATNAPEHRDLFAAGKLLRLALVEVRGFGGG